MKRLIVWLRLLFEFGLSSGFAQVMGMLSGLAYVRYMAIADYALYGLAATTMTFVALSSDLGLNSSVIYFWRRARAEAVPFEGYLAGIMRLRFGLFVVVGLLAAILFPVLTAKSNYRGIDLAIALALLLATSLAMLTAGVKLQLLRLLGRFRAAYACDIAGQSMRVIVAGLMLLGVSHSYWLALAGGLACSTISLIGTQYFLRGEFDKAAVAPPGTMKSILRYVGPAAPLVLAFALQDTIIIWLSSRFGGPEVVASVFAVSRITTIVGVLSGFTVVVIVPRLSNIQDARKFQQAGWLAKGAMALVGLAIVGAAIVLPQPFLWLIGPRYAHLTSELVVAMGTAAIALVNTPTILLNRAKGWVRLDPILAAAQSLLLLVLVFIWDFSNPLSVLWLGFVMGGSLFLQSLAVSVAGGVNPVWVQAKK